MLTKSSTRVTVSVENTRVTVAGRAYSRPHVIVAGPRELRLVLDSSSGVRLEASFADLPQVEALDKDVIKIIGREARFQVDSVRPAEALREFEGYVELESDKMTFKFEVDESGSVAIIAPNLGRIRGSAAEIEVSGAPAALNMITLPFITGVLHVSGRARAQIRMRDGRIYVKITGAR